eukprot:SAG11_NODE_254_length_11587_cov_4.312913_9_plen_69_part_00
MTTRTTTPAWAAAEQLHAFMRDRSGAAMLMLNILLGHETRANEMQEWRGRFISPMLLARVMMCVGQRV